MKAELAGFIAIGAIVAVLAYLVPDEQVRMPMWIFIYISLIACAWFCWRHPKAPLEPKGWLQYVGGAFLAGIVMSAIDAILHGPQSGHVIFDMSLAVLAGIVAGSGAIYSWIKQENAA